jgi:HPt (histidine-containing phosphotransfer) domain-containing protein
MIDWNRVQDLRSEIGFDDFDDVVTLFLDEADEVVSRLTGLTDARAIESELHFLKGSALNLGFSELAMICQTGERRAATGDDTVSMDAVVAVYHQSREAFLGGMKHLAA